MHEGRAAEYRAYRKDWLEYPANFILRDFPMHLDIEATSRCNLRCTFCDKLPSLNKEQMGDIQFSLYKKIVTEGAKYKLLGVKLSYRGEPLLHKDIVQMVAYAKEKGILDVYFNTNGMLLDAGLCEQLIDAGLDRISVSIEGTDATAFENQRIGASFDTILNNIDILRHIRQKKGFSYPKIRIQTIFYPGMDIEAYKAFWMPHCDEVAAIDYKDGVRRQKGLVRDWGCPQLWQRMTIQWDGTVLACNNDDSRLFSPGNVNAKSIHECWHDKVVENARQMHKIGRSHEINACDGCPWRTAQICKLDSNDKAGVKS